jgi:lycopene cyclase domain-containing protein
MPEYTVLSVLAVLGVLAAERWWWRTGLLRTGQFWCAMALVFFFQTLVDGWLTKLSAPIVSYHPAQITGLRFPFDVPVEDYGFGFAMVCLSLIRWVRHTRDDLAAQPDRPAPEGDS